MRRGGGRGNNFGVLALSRETGYSAATISRKLSRGLSPDNIRSQTRLVVAQERAEAAATYATDQTAPSRAPKRDGQMALIPTLPVSPQPVRIGQAGGAEYEAALTENAMFEKLGNAKLRRAQALAERAEIENEQRRGELVPVAYMRRWGMRFLIDGRDELLKGPSELADSLAAESDPVRAEQILRGWVEQTLAKFANLQALWACPQTQK